MRLNKRLAESFTSLILTAAKPSELDNKLMRLLLQAFLPGSEDSSLLYVP